MSTNGSEAQHSLFISDLHLCASRPHITEQFINFIEERASFAEALYILGDLFEYWAGDDDIDDTHHHVVIQSLSHLNARGTRCYLIHGNRDFLLGEGFSRASNLEILTDPTQLTLYGHRVLLSHGDALCTDDIAYQDFRKQVRRDEWQSTFLSQPLPIRKAQIESLRMRSEQEKSEKSEQIMDVNHAAVASLLREYQYPEIFIHGHTHRPAMHTLEIDQHTIQRWVLGDWYEQGSCLRLDRSGCMNIPLSSKP